MNKSNNYFSKKTIKDVPLQNKTVLLRVDFNVPMQDGEVASDYRVVSSLPTIEYLLSQNCKIIIITHLGRPEGKPDKRYSLLPVFKVLQSLLPKTQMHFTKDCIDDSARLLCKKAKNGEIVLLENLRFHAEEEANDLRFAKQLKQVSGADYFAQDGFGVVHRAHASTSAIAQCLPAVAGLLLEKEVEVLQFAMKKPQHPVVAIVGGAKISDKIGFIEKLLAIADTVLIGGAMANTFFKEQGLEIGKSRYEQGQSSEIATILQKSKKDQLILPIDVAVASEIATNSQRRDCAVNDVRPDEYILDLGFETMRNFGQKIKGAATIIWNGTLGLAEIPQFAQGSSILSQQISNEHGATSIIGGGDTADFTLDWLSDHTNARFTHISTGGGASLELMSGMKLPGVEALMDS